MFAPPLTPALQRCLPPADSGEKWLVAKVRKCQRCNTSFAMVVRRGDLISREIIRTGKWEIGRPSEMGDLATNWTWPAWPAWPQRPVFLDIGGNLGYYSLLFAHHGYDVLTVEPMAQNRLAIEASLCINPELRRRVRLIPASVGRTSGALCSIVPSNVHHNRGNGVIGKCGGRRSAANGSESVPMTTLDLVLQQSAAKRVDVVKIDIEGYECEAIAGGQSLFGRYHPALIQWEGVRSNVDRCMRSQARRHGYRVGSLTGWDRNTVMVQDRR